MFKMPEEIEAQTSLYTIEYSLIGLCIKNAADNSHKMGCLYWDTRITNYF